MTTKYLVKCSCGHTGQIVMKDNDTPNTERNWEIYTVRSLNSTPSPVPPYASWDFIFSAMHISCPKCDSILTSCNLIDNI